MNKKELENALIFPQGEKNPYGAYFTGQSYLEGMIADKDLPFGVGNVTFEPGCRNPVSYTHLTLPTILRV